jgi:hypothetical protein
VTKIRTINDLQDRLDHDFGWRLKELANLKALVSKSEGAARKTAVRAAVCVTYAHWEGFIKESSENYVRFVSNQRLRLEELADCFVVFAAKRHLNSITATGKAALAIATVEFFRNRMVDRANLSIANLIRTESNLSSTVLENILVAIGFEPAMFSARFNQIDIELVERRNRIAHGEYLDLEADSCRQLTDDVISMLRLFKSQIENAASLASYRVSSSP